MGIYSRIDANVISVLPRVKATEVTTGSDNIRHRQKQTEDVIDLCTPSWSQNTLPGHRKAVLLRDSSVYRIIRWNKTVILAGIGRTWLQVWLRQLEGECF